MKNSVENIEMEVINFVAARLENFRRIHYGYLMEVINNKFPTYDVKSLLQENLIKTKRAKLKRGYLLIQEDAGFYN